MITKLFYWHILNMNRGSLHTRSFRYIHLSVFRYRLVKNDLLEPKRFWDFWEMGLSILYMYMYICSNYAFNLNQLRLSVISIWYTKNFQLTCATQWITGDGWYSCVCRHTAHFGGGDGGTSWVQIVMSVMTCICAIIGLRKRDSNLIHCESAYYKVTWYRFII